MWWMDSSLFLTWLMPLCSALSSWLALMLRSMLAMFLSRFNSACLSSSTLSFNNKKSKHSLVNDHLLLFLPVIHGNVVLARTRVRDSDLDPDLRPVYRLHLFLNIPKWFTFVGLLCGSRRQADTAMLRSTRRRCSRTDTPPTRRLFRNLIKTRILWVPKGTAINWQIAKIEFSKNIRNRLSL